MARELGLREVYGERLVDTLAERLGGLATLLLFDNCEHLLDSTARLAESLLRRCPELRILATSHEPLRVPGETVWRIAPMTVPERDDPAAPEEAALAESVRLFEARAVLARSTPKHSKCAFERGRARRSRRQPDPALRSGSRWKVASYSQQGSSRA